ncbi:MAG: aminoacyl-tRNA hydrolase [Nesterenkonia sp.]|uniref:aminoacyl-tRNA hydrolase n=1 Tax=Nesterenkonia marinintestina TaxID=2979865 RepID=UPI0021BDF9E0|nr:aminoacyl-tRNA hydrolase [Nesterenkonia sp. GX14115]MDO5492834.1 aminoacyl-tRNA hydrolase [Nesterenkonia sp.]
MTSGSWLIVGLGNPGDKYRGTRHNIGQVVIDELVSRMGATLSRTKIGARVVAARLGVGGPRVVLAVSEGYMNVSGKPVRALMDYFDVDDDHLLVIHDEVDLDFGRIKLKQGGSEGGHNGLRSITQHLGGERDYLRLRAGVGRPSGRTDTSDHVLGRFASAEREQLPEFVSRCADAAESVVVEGLVAAQNAAH